VLWLCRGCARAKTQRLLISAGDCGMKYLPREVAFGKLKALADGARIVRAELS
jgi:5-methyltetrahydropteroyltriglutamate--homocysteine methyltransferase